MNKNKAYPLPLSESANPRLTRQTHCQCLYVITNDLDVVACCVESVEEVVWQGVAVHLDVCIWVVVEYALDDAVMTEQKGGIERCPYRVYVNIFYIARSDWK